MNATAFVVGASGSAGGMLLDIARQLGFTSVHAFSNLRRMERLAAQTPLSFFLFAAVADPGSLGRTAESIRRSSSQRIRFAPMIYFADAPSLGTVRQCIDLGFDDVVTVPYSVQRVEERLRRQLDTTLYYFETQSYFGPDRRGRLPGHLDTHPQRGAGGDYRRIELLRSLTSGIELAEDDQQVMI